MLGRMSTSPAPDPRQADNPVKLPTDKELVLRVIPMPADCNANGDIFGGWLLSQMDIAGGAARPRATGHRGGEPVHLQATGEGG